MLYEFQKFDQRTYYDLLDVPASATAEAIEAAFRKKALMLHPDHNPTYTKAAEAFKDIYAAYLTLTDPAKRIAYDKAMHITPYAAPDNADFNPHLFEMATKRYKDTLGPSKR